MQTFRLALHSLKRDWRSGEVGLIAAAVVIAVASMTSVGFFTDRVHKALGRQATELLAADLVLDSRAPIPHRLRTDAREYGLDTTETLRFRSVVVRDDKLQMAEVKAVEAGYPLRGSLRTASTLFGRESVAATLPQPGQAWADARLLQALDMQVGDRITLGKSTLTVSAVLTYEPDRGGDLFNIAPRLLINLADVPATGLILPGSRVRYSLLLSGAADSIAAFRNKIDQRDDPELRIEGIRDARPELKRALERSEQFLGLAALVSIALAGLAVAMSAQRYALRHYDHCAIMRCLGAPQRTITGIYFLQLVIVSATAAIIGAGAGFAIQNVLSMMLSNMSRQALPAPSLMPLYTGVLMGMVIACGFALPQLWQLRNVSPLRVLRRDLLRILTFTPLRPPSSPPWSISRMPANSPSSSTKSRSNTSNTAWPNRAACSTAPPWPPPSTCCAPTT